MDNSECKLVLVTNTLTNDLLTTGYSHFITGNSTYVGYLALK